MNIKDLQKSDYTIVDQPPASGKMNVKDLPTGSYKTGDPNYVPADISKPSATDIANKRLGVAPDMSQTPAGWIKKDVLGGGAETPKSGVGGFLGQVFKITIGSEGIAGVAQMPGKVISEAGSLPEEQGLSDTAGRGAEMATKLLQSARTEQNPDKKALMISRAKELFNNSLEISGQRDTLSKQDITPEKAAGTTINAATTVATLMGGAGAQMAEQMALKDIAPTAGKQLVGKILSSLPVRAAESAIIGSTYQVGDNLVHDRPVGDNVKSTALFSAFIPVGAEALSKIGQKFASPVVQYLTKKLPAQLINSDIKPLEKEFSFGKNPGEGIVEEGITANSKQDLVDKIQQKKSDIWKEATAILKDPKIASKTADVSQTTGIVDKAITDAVKGGKQNQSLINGLINFKETLTDGFNLDAEGKIVSTGQTRDLSKLSVADRQLLKQQIGENTMWTGAGFDKEINQVKSKVYRALDQSIDTDAPGMAKTNSRYANMLSAQKAAERQVLRESKAGLVKNASRFGIGAGIVGALVTGNYKVAGEIALAGLVEEGATSVAARTRVAQFLRALAPAEREGIMGTNQTLRNIYSRLYGKEPDKATPGFSQMQPKTALPKAPEAPPLGLPAGDPSKVAIPMPERNARLDIQKSGAMPQPNIKPAEQVSRPGQLSLPPAGGASPTQTTIPMRGPTTYEPPAKTIGGEGQMSTKITAPQTTSHENFAKSIENIPAEHNAFVTKYTPEEYKNMKTFSSSDGKSGYAIKPDGDLVSVFNYGEKGNVKKMVQEAIKNGATKLDAFDGYLTKDFYPQFGFKEVKREPWSDEFSPKNWNLTKDKKPDIVYMELSK